MKVTVRYHNAYNPEQPSNFSFNVDSFDKALVRVQDGLISIGSPDLKSVLTIKTIDLVDIVAE